MPGQSSVWLWVAIAVFVAWRVALRVKRMVARQRLSVLRTWLTALLFPCLILLLLLLSINHSGSTLGLVSGLAIGSGLGWWGIRLTQFEVTDAGMFFTPNAPLGLALSALFIGRVLYRAAEMAFVDGGFSPQQADIAGSPLTLVIFGTLAGYWVVHAIGLLRWRRQVRRQQQESVPASASGSSTGTS